MQAGRALVTGVSGFVGGYLAEELLSHGWEVAGSAPPASWDEFSASALVDKVVLIPWDLGGSASLPAEVGSALREFRPTAIFHLAAISVPEKCGGEEPTPEAWQVNVEGTRHVLELAASLRPIPTVLVVSSSHVYGEVKWDSPVVDENAPLAPRSGYGKTKKAAEDLAQRAIKDGLPVIIVRAFHHSGPRQRPPMLLPQWASQFADPSTTEVVVYSLDVWLDLCDVRDVVRAYRLLVERGRPGVFNVGSGRAVCTREIFDLLTEISGRALPAKQIRPGRRHEPVADLARISEATGWQPQIPLRQTVADTLAWWQNRQRKSC
ncbi:MAG: GDP-mannose 4,6-dehydratase [Thermoguttaceae bacterium]|nr:GDP-mannose 4,6-dehydratase [Thermoguttaceae bacterium]MDW8079869.1 GDP-mannose 4,6-dehydratase [Thermoguttaceae bacterium]